MCWECSLLCFTETWLIRYIPDCLVELDGFTLVRAFRGQQSSRKKKKKGGLAVFVNSKWCNPGYVMVNEMICTPDIQLLAIGPRPYYLPREFTHAIVAVLYIPSSALAVQACDVIHSTVTILQTLNPSAMMTINGDHVSFSKTLTNFTQDHQELRTMQRTLMGSPNALQTISSSVKRALKETKTVHCFPNNKPWINNKILILLNRKPPNPITIQGVKWWT